MGTQVIQINLKNCYSGSDYASLEKILSHRHGVQHVHLDRTRGIAHASFDPTVTDRNKVKS